MNDRTESLLKQYEPILSIVVYKADMYDYYLESHIIDKKGRLLAGKPLEEKTIEEIVEVFYTEQKENASITGIIPENLLKFQELSGGKYEMIWYKPEEKRNIFFHSNLKITSGVCWSPALLYHAYNNSLSVIALGSNERPTLETKTYKAPFYNTSSNGSICLGSAKAKPPKEKTYDSLMKYWEDMFWLSEFTHLSDNNPTKTNLSSIYRKIINTDTKWSDMDELIESKLTLKNVFNGALHR